MVSATLTDIVRRYKAPKFGSKEAVRMSFDDFPDKVSMLKILNRCPCLRKESLLTDQCKN